MRFLILLTICLAAVTALPHGSQRIAGGSTAMIQQYPSIAGLLYSAGLITYTQQCAGVIINTRSVLTVAHCTQGTLAPNQWRIRVGSTGSTTDSIGTIYSVSQVINHPNFNARTNENDIAILRTHWDIVYTTMVNAAFFANSTYNIADNQVVWTAGWGDTSAQGVPSTTLRHVQIWTFNQATCAYNYAWIGSSVTPSMLCAGWPGVGGRGQCPGDSGSPLYHNGVVVGIYSFGNGCGLANYPGVNTRVSSFASWIAANA